MRRAFTLVEVIVALTIAGVIALAARAAIVGGLDTQERLEEHTARSEAEVRFRSLAVSALRHMTDAPTPGAQAFVIRDTVTEAGPSHIVEFYSRGLGLPAGTGSPALVRLAPSVEGLTISAHAPNGALNFYGDLTSSVAVRARVQTLAGEWVAAWPRSLQLPATVVIELVPKSDGTGAPVPIVVTTQLAGTS
jgi:prepilin-type N-terminal cleavage/methylation domain-containing protein